MAKRKTPTEALIRYVEPTASTACWPWQGYRDDEGYGTVWVDGRTRKAHRLAYEAASGPIPEGMVIRHTCDNPPCCNPRHLLVGTVRDNTADKLLRGRQPRGERAYQARLTERDIPIIRARSAAGESDTSLAQDFGVTRGTIYLVVSRKTWKHVEDVAA